MKPSWTVVLLVLLVGCGTTARVVRLDTGQGKLLIPTSRGGHQPVKLREDELQKSMTELVRDVRPDTRPLRYARALMFESWQEEGYLEWTGRKLVPVSAEARRLLPAQDELTRGYGHWCESTRRSRDCLSLVGLRPVSTSGPPTIDVRVPGIGIREIKFLP